MSDELNAVEVTISEEMIAKFAELYGLDAVAEREAILGVFTAWSLGKGELVSYLTDAPETRELFAELRKAYFTSAGFPVPEAYSNVSFVEGVAEKSGKFADDVSSLQGSTVPAEETPAQPESPAEDAPAPAPTEPATEQPASEQPAAEEPAPQEEAPKAEEPAPEVPPEA